MTAAYAANPVQTVQCPAASGAGCIIGLEDDPAAFRASGGDAAGLGDLGHGELAWRRTCAGFFRSAWDHLACARPYVRGHAQQPTLPVRSLISAALYSAIRANMPNLPCAMMVSTIPLVSERTPTLRPAGWSLVDEVAQVAAESVDLPDGGARTQSTQAGVPFGPPGLGCRSLTELLFAHRTAVRIETALRCAAYPQPR